MPAFHGGDNTYLYGVRLTEDTMSRKDPVLYPLIRAKPNISI